MRYPVAIEPGDERHAFGIVFPDLPGCFSAGDTIEDALANAEEAALLWLQDALDQGNAPPPARALSDLVSDPDYSGWAFAVVPVDLSRIEGPALRINITVAQRALEEIDAAAQRSGTSRSGFLVSAALEHARRADRVGESGPRYAVRRFAAKAITKSVKKPVRAVGKPAAQRAPSRKRTKR